MILDRDGTINIEKNYLFRIEEFEFIAGVPETIRSLNKSGFKVIVITNQSGIARGYFTEDEVRKLHGYINQELGKYAAHIDAFYVCPHHPDEGCECRKPNTKLYTAALKEWEIDTARSYMVGDKTTDLTPGKQLGMKTILVETGYGKQQIYDARYCDYQVESLKEIIKILC
ncbi:MAG: HAD family hydrolase [Clostridia bacterium]|nr:HAD family hydrolase [Clostridia bacterium]